MIVECSTDRYTRPKGKWMFCPRTDTRGRMSNVRRKDTSNVWRSDTRRLQQHCTVVRRTDILSSYVMAKSVKYHETPRQFNSFSHLLPVDVSASTVPRTWCGTEGCRSDHAPDVEIPYGRFLLSPPVFSSANLVLSSCRMCCLYVISVKWCLRHGRLKHEGASVVVQVCHSSAPRAPHKSSQDGGRPTWR